MAAFSQAQRADDQCESLKRARDAIKAIAASNGEKAALLSDRAPTVVVPPNGTSCLIQEAFGKRLVNALPDVPVWAA
jgi:hypothetical protein